MFHNYIDPLFRKTAFNCVFCGAFSTQDWGRMLVQYRTGPADEVLNADVCFCQQCKRYSFWYPDGCVYPTFGATLPPNPDMPEDIKQDYEEARSIVGASPRGAVALLRLAVQKLCKHLGEPGKNINDDIASLVKKGLPETVQQALDSVRVVGNNAVHPGQIDFADNAGIANGLFVMVNFICANRITEPNMINQFYQATVPADTQGHIAKRDGKI